ncbi:hypothetical protein DSO57_1005423 [Entomophthora muscae]|uniref:Uncharacterized protein n=1 Tax=Entomophthora muscae TaxID=34485 RepID=A0ACC2TUZ7_9FUNG|nr:hypothetical protein DSO57_1005423 [Entomophthora muscae]
MAGIGCPRCPLRGFNPLGWSNLRVESTSDPIWEWRECNSDGGLDPFPLTYYLRASKDVYSVAHPALTHCGVQRIPVDGSCIHPEVLQAQLNL